MHVCFSGRLTAVWLCPHVRRWSHVCQMNISRHTVMLNTPSDAWRPTWGPGNSVMLSSSPETAEYQHTGNKKTIHTFGSLKSQNLWKFALQYKQKHKTSVPQIMELSLWNIVKTIQMISHSHLAEPNSFNLYPKTSVNPVTGFSSVWGLWQDLSRSSPCCWIINALEMLEMSDGSYSLLQNVAAVAHL